MQAGYFAQPVEARPLLHTWSLGVEEQFYLAFPILLVAIWRFAPRRLTAIICGLCVLSFGLNVLTVGRSPGFAFFLAPPRVWELFTGALLAVGAITHPRRRWQSEAAGLAGAILIGVAVFGFSKATPFPGFAALLPAGGAAAIIWAGLGKDAFVTRLLSRPEPVFVGKISYSLYLWHFPLLSFGSYLVIGGLSRTANIGLLALSFALAVASWIVIEQPVRRGRWMFASPRFVFRSAGLSLLLLCSVGAAARLTGGFPSRFGADELQIFAGEHDVDPDRVRCLALAQANQAGLPPACRFGAAGAQQTVALWGDSHAESLRAGIDAAARKEGRAGFYVGYAGCIPALGIDRNHPGCSSANAAIVAYLESQPSIHTVILAGRWGLWAEGSPYKSEGGNPITMTTAAGAPIDNHTALATGLAAAIARLAAAGKQVWLIGPVPEIGFNVPRALYLNRLGIMPEADIRPTLDEFTARQRFVLDLMARLAAKYGARVIWPHRTLCGAHRCRVQIGSHVLYSDDQHLTRYAAVLLAPTFASIFREHRTARP
jgi:hypothetical protein